MKTRTTTRYREVEHVEGGVPRIIEEPYTVEVPVAPHDWDRIVFNGAMTAAVGFTAVSIGWSAVSAGALLATTAPDWIAYPAAFAYDAAWITCMALEWLSRYDDERATVPRRLGYVALLVAMAAICTHGVLTAGVAEGVAGAVISLIAKGLWALVLRHTSQALPYRTREWLRVSRAEMGAQLALASQQRQLTRVQAQHAALLAAIGLPADATGRTQDTAPDTSGHDDRTVRSAVRAARTAMPDASAEDITKQLAAARITTDEDTVADILNADTDTTDSRSGASVRPIAPAGASIADSVRTALASGITDTPAVLSYVRTLHGQDVSADTVNRTRRRIERTAS